MNSKIDYFNFLDLEKNQFIKTQNTRSPKIIEKSDEIAFGHHSFFPDMNIGKAIRIPIKASPVIIPELISIPLSLLCIVDEIKPPINIGTER